MDVILVMLAGVLIGAKWFPERFKKQNETLQVVCTALLIFSMGVMLGQRENHLAFWLQYRYWFTLRQFLPLVRVDAAFKCSQTHLTNPLSIHS